MNQEEFRTTASSTFVLDGTGKIKWWQRIWAIIRLSVLTVALGAILALLIGGTLFVVVTYVGQSLN